MTSKQQRCDREEYPAPGHNRERTAGESPPKAQAKASLERGQEMARRLPAVTGFESRVGICTLNSGGNTDNLFALSLTAQGVFIFEHLRIPLTFCFN